MENKKQKKQTHSLMMYEERLGHRVDNAKRHLWRCKSIWEQVQPSNIMSTTSFHQTISWSQCSQFVKAKEEIKIITLKKRIDRVGHQVDHEIGRILCMQKSEYKLRQWNKFAKFYKKNLWIQEGP